MLLILIEIDQQQHEYQINAVYLSDLPNNHSIYIFFVLSLSFTHVFLSKIIKKKEK